jgi:hypothetical protein
MIERFEEDLGKYAYISLPQVKDYLSISSNTQEARLSNIVSYATGVVEHYIGQEVLANDYVEIAGTTSSTDVTLEHYPADTGIPRPAIPAAIVTLQYIAPLAYSNVYVSAQTNGSATVSHFANDTADKTYGYVIVG